MPLPMLYTKEEASGICVSYGAADALWHSDQVDTIGHEAYVQIAIMGDIQLLSILHPAGTLCP